MLKISKTKKIILAACCTFGLSFTAVEIPKAQAVYESKSDTGTEIFDYIENQIERQNAFTMEQFAKSVDKFLTFNDYKILSGKGSVSAAQAKSKAESEYDIFNKTQRIDSDFDKQLRKMFGNNN